MANGDVVQTHDTMSAPLFTLRANAQLTREQWQRFCEKARQNGTTPGQILYRTIHDYIGERAHADHQDDQQPPR